LRYANRRRIEELAKKSGERLRIVDGESAYLPLGKEITQSEQIVAAVQSLLQPE
jgi:hypothetical protein